jgi:hypothetical protein
MRDFKPMTLANMRLNGVRFVIASCANCGGSADVNVDLLPETLTVPEAGHRLRCSHCGGKTISTRPAWHTSQRPSTPDYRRERPPVSWARAKRRYFTPLPPRVALGQRSGMRGSVMCPAIVENSRNSNRGRAGCVLALLSKLLVKGVGPVLHRSSDFLSMLIVVLVRYRRIQNNVRRLVQDRSAARSVGSGESADCGENLGSIVGFGELVVAQRR